MDLVDLTDSVTNLGVGDRVRGGLGQRDRLVRGVMNLIKLIDLVTNSTNLSVEWCAWASTTLCVVVLVNLTDLCTQWWTWST